MAWNEPGKDRDPWGGGNGRGGPESDLDRLMRNLQRKLSGLFGGGGGNGGGSSWAAFAWIPALLLAGWLLTGFYQVDAGERGVISRFGAFHHITQPGLRWHLPWPVESRETVDIGKVRSHNYKTEMLTSDANLVDIGMGVQYQVKHTEEGIYNYVFNVRNPEETLADVADSVLREVIGRHTLDEILTGDTRVEIGNQTQVQIQQVLDEYSTGIDVARVNFEEVLLPQSVRSAAEDVNRAEEDRNRMINEAQAYTNDILPRARGQAARRIEEATAYREEVIAEAQGNAARFDQLLAEYRQAPQVTRKRLYLETMERVLGGLPKIMVDVENGENLIYLPLDRYLRQQGAMPESGAAMGGAVQQNGGSQNDSLRDNRTRELR